MKVDEFFFVIFVENCRVLMYVNIINRTFGSVSILNFLKN